MIGRREFGMAGLSALAFGAASTQLAAAEPDTTHAHARHKEMFEECAKACSDCQRACDSCAAHCAELLSQGKKEHLETLRTCCDCAVFCAAAAQIVAASGPFSGMICKACAMACAECGKACEKFPDDKQMKACAEECRKCEKACKAMTA